MKSKKFFHEFVLLLLLGIAIGTIAIQSNLNFTGHAVLDGCDGDWTCADWTTCADSTQTRTCTDANTCGTTTSKPAESQSCTVCEESWTCENWSVCSGSTKTRSCTDTNACGTIVNKPSTSHSCTEETTTITTPITTESVEPIITTEPIIETPVITCTPEWKCGDWQECVQSTQTRICLDNANCNTQEGIPATSQACVAEIKETCSDKIKNQDETSVDCGGVCKKCGIFTIAGSVINGPMGKVKEILSNKTTWIMIFTVIGISLAAFFGVKFFSKHKIQITTKK